MNDDPIAAETAETLLAVTPMQRGLWYLDHVGDGQHLLIKSALRIDGPLDAGRLERALAVTLGRHEALRSRFVARDGVPWRVVAARPAAPIRRVDVSALRRERRDASLDVILRQLGETVIDLGAAPPLAACLVVIAPRLHVLWIAVHHVVFDEASNEIFCRDLIRAYLARPFEDQPAKFSDYVNWLNESSAGPEIADDAVFWSSALAGFEPSLLPGAFLAHVHPASASAPCVTERVMTREQALGVAQLARAFRCTPFVILLGLMGLTLSRMGAQRDVVISTPVQLRPEDDGGELIGLCLTTLPLRMEVREASSPIGFFEALRDLVYESWAHRFLPFDDIVANHDGGGGAVHPLMTYMFALQGRPIAFEDLGEVDLDVVGVCIDQAVPGSALALVAVPGGGTYRLNASFRPGGFPAASVAKFLETYVELLEGCASGSAAALGELTLRAFPVARAIARRDPPTVWSRVEAAYVKWPDRIVCYEPGPVSMLELRRRIEAVTAALVADGVACDDRVALDLPRDAWLIAAQCAILRLGAAFVPLGDDWPEDLIQRIVARCRLVLVGARGGRAGTSAVRARVITGGVAADVRSDLPVASPHPLAAAYVLHTSGSTGQPQAVVIPHRALDRFVDWAATHFRYEAETVIAAGTPLVFDMSIIETLLPAACGFGCLMVGKLAELIDHPQAERVTWINSVPTVLRELLVARRVPSTVRTVTVGGEPVDSALVAMATSEWNKVEVCNGYGPTEITIFATTSWLARDGVRDATYAAPDIGVATCWHDVRVIDHAFNSLPPWALGMIAVGGPCVASGYWDAPDLTAAKFRPDPHGDVPGAILHLTGDVGFMTDDGRLHLVGRIDHQVKVSGIRIDMAGIEFALRGHPDVGDAACIMVDPSTNARRLVAAVVPRVEGATIDPIVLREWVARQVPQSHVPRHIECRDHLPRTASGKIDRRQLAQVLSEPRIVSSTAWSSAESRIAAIWTGVLGRDVCDIDANFFDLGGSSLHLTRLVGQLRAEGASVTVTDMFRHTTVRQQARLVNARPPQPGALAVDALDRAARIRAAYAQAGQG